MSFAPLLRRSASTVGTCVCNRHAAAAAAAAAGSSRSMTTATATAISNAVTLKCSPKLASSSACCSSRTFSSSTAHRTAAAADATITASFPPANSAEHTELLQRAKARLVHLGFHHQESFWEQRICWGDHDCFQHVNNVHYVRFVESARMRYGEVLASRLTSQRAQDIVKGTGKGMILAKISVKYIRPVTYPDTLLIGTRPVLPLQGSDRFTLQANIVSLKQQALVATADQLCVSYDYPALTKCDLPRDLKDEIEKSGAGAGAGAAP